jgi:hypothetical protein
MLGSSGHFEEMLDLIIRFGDAYGPTDEPWRLLSQMKEYTTYRVVEQRQKWGLARLQGAKRIAYCSRFLAWTAPSAMV